MDSSDDDDDVLDESKSFFHMTPSFHLDLRQQQQHQQQQQHRHSKQESPNNIRKQGRRTKRAQFGVKSHKRRQRQQKQQQVSPDSPFGSGTGNNNSNLLYHSPSPSPSLTTRKDSFLAGSRSFIQGDEDTSILSMIFSGDNNSMMALYQDALYDDHGQKCQLQHLWTEERRPHTSPMTVSRGFLSHMRKDCRTMHNERNGRNADWPSSEGSAIKQVCLVECTTRMQSTDHWVPSGCKTSTANIQCHSLR
ncbi:unnamed protein product [Absidia cylindrospora]